MEKIIILIVFALISNLVKSSRNKNNMDNKLEKNKPDVFNTLHNQHEENENIRFKSTDNGNVIQDKEKNITIDNVEINKVVNDTHVQNSKVRKFESLENKSYKPSIDSEYLDDNVDENFNSSSKEREGKSFSFDISNDLQRAVIAAEILGLPRALKKNIR